MRWKILYLLEQFLDILKQQVQSEDSNPWDDLTAFEKDEVLKAYEKSKDANNLIGMRR